MTTATKAGTRKPTPIRLSKNSASDGVACLCLSIGGAAATDTLERVFGAASYASGASLAELSPQMDELFLSALRELSAPKPMRS